MGSLVGGLSVNVEGWPRLGVGSATDAQPALARTGRQNSPGPAAADHIRHIRGGGVCVTVCLCVFVCMVA